MPRNTANATVTAFNTLDGLGSFPFARHYSGNHFCFLFLQVLRCFSSLGCLLYPMDSDTDDTALPVPGCPIRTSAGIGLFPPDRSLSQVVTSFIDFSYQGIHRMPLVT